MARKRQMLNSTSESTSSALETAAMNLESTNKSNVESPVSSASNGANGHTPTVTNPSVAPNPAYQPTEVVKPMQENVKDTQEKRDATKNNVSEVYGDYADYQLLPDAPWPPPIFVRKSISPQERYYLEHRWYSQWSFFDKKASENKNRYYRTQLIVGIGSVTVPVLVGINAQGIAGSVLYFVTVFVSLAVAMATAVESLYTFGDNWRSYRSAAEDLHQEKSLYDVKAGRYANNAQAFMRFVERCEEIIAQQNGRWIQSQEKAAEQLSQDAEEFAEVYGGQAAKTDEFGNPIASTITSTTTSTTESTPEGQTTHTESSYTEVTENENNSEEHVSDSDSETYTPDPTTEGYVDPNIADPAAPTSFG
jgi:uncharacterized lipoprotein NlpE involved in copper resistance